MPNAETQTIVTDCTVEEVVESPLDTPQKPNYEVVFFVRYNVPNVPRPSDEQIKTFFNKYGVVHHVKCPENRNFAFVYMTSLNTSAEHRRTRATISQIIHEMTPENRFHITVASSNYRRFQQRPFQHQPLQQGGLSQQRLLQRDTSTNEERNSRGSYKHYPSVQREPAPRNSTSTHRGPAPLNSSFRQYPRDPNDTRHDPSERRYHTNPSFDQARSHNSGTMGRRNYGRGVYTSN